MAGSFPNCPTSRQRWYEPGFSVTNLKYFRLFFPAYANRSPEIRHKPCDQLSELDQASALADLSAALEATEMLKGFSPNLGWSHYRSLSRIEHHAERLFYEIESERCNWPETGKSVSARWTSSSIRMCSTFSIFPRRPGCMCESLPEAAVIEKLQPFLLELRKGFACIARQHRVSTESQLSPAHKTHCHLDEFALSCRFRRPATGMPEKLIYESFLTLKEAAEYLKVNELSVY